MTTKKQTKPQKMAKVTVALPTSGKPAGVGMGMSKGMTMKAPGSKPPHRGGNLGKWLHPAKKKG